MTHVPVPVHNPAYITDSERVRHSPGAFRTALGALKSWGLNDGQCQRVLGIPRSTFQRWKKNSDVAVLSSDQLERVSYVLGVRAALEIMLPGEENKEVRNGWLHRPNKAPLFGGQPPMKRLVGGRVADLYELRRYLDAQRGW